MMKIILMINIILTTRVPGKTRQSGEASEQVEECPGDNDAVVDVEIEDHRHGRHPHTLQHGTQLRHQGHAPCSQILTHGNLLEEYGNTTEYHRNEVNNQECT